MSIMRLSNCAALSAGLALAICPATRANDLDTGLVFEGTTECTVPEAAFSVYKDVTVCFDPIDTGAGVPPDACDPFPNDGNFTYIYKLRNDPASALGTVGLEVTVLVEPGAIIDAGVIAGSVGVPPSFTLVEADRVTWYFAGNPILPGDMSQELYIVSPLGPEERQFAVLGEFGIDCTSTCIGPGVVCEFCETGGDDNDDDDDDDNDDGGTTPINILFNCPSGPASGGHGVVDGGEYNFNTGTLTATTTTEVSFDPACGTYGSDPFPNDGKFTYTYVLNNDATSSTGLCKYRIKVAENSVVDAGVLAGPGVVPSSIKIRSDRVIFRFADDTIDPGESSAVLYLRSARGPGMHNGKVFGTDDTRSGSMNIAPGG